MRFVVVVLILWNGWGFASELKRDSSSPIDHFLDCATKALGRPVLVDASTLPQIVKFECGGHADFVARLQDAGYRVFLDADWAIILNADSVRRSGWTDGRVEVQLNEKDKPLPAATREQLLHGILTNAGFFPAEPVSSSLRASTVRYVLLLDVYRPAIVGKDVVVVLIHLGEDDPNASSTSPSGRVIYGELQGKTAELRWQSPIVQTTEPLTFDDLNGDGIPEILVWSRWIENTRMSFQTLTAFDKEGNELTRQDDCEFEGGATIIGGTTCPIVGTEVSVISDVTPKLITYWGGPNEEKNVVLKLVKGRYVRVSSNRRSRGSQH